METAQGAPLVGWRRRALRAVSAAYLRRSIANS